MKDTKVPLKLIALLADGEFHSGNISVSHWA